MVQGVLVAILLKGFHPGFELAAPYLLRDGSEVQVYASLVAAGTQRGVHTGLHLEGPCRGWFRPGRQRWERCVAEHDKRVSRDHDRKDHGDRASAAANPRVLPDPSQNFAPE